MKTRTNFVVNQRITKDGKPSTNTTEWPEKQDPEPLKHQVNYTSGDDSEMMLPTGFKLLANGEIETPIDRQVKAKTEVQETKQQTDSDSEPLLPAGIKLEN
ncbi:MAG: hypothetical protein WD267_11500 [Balneolales bacterium]